VYVDGGIPSDLTKAARAAESLEAAGYDGGWSAETNHDPFLPLALAAEHTTRLSLGTGIAVAFARNPMTVANVGWDLQAYSGGRFTLGLGSQIKPHIEKRFSMPWSQPAARMREFVLALRAIWAAWQDGSPLRFEGSFYTHKLMTPFFVPEPHPYGPPGVFLAAVGDLMTEVCGEVADGMLVHAFTTERYLREVTVPALERGMGKSGRTRQDFQLSCPVFVVTGATDAERADAERRTREQIAFYASTPAYRPVLDLHGWGELQPELNALSKRGEWVEMGRRIGDDVLETFAVVDEPSKVAGRIVERYGDVLDRVSFYARYDLPPDEVAAIVDGFHRS
jgi:probable F420-dependent oxidoreductase